jgi:hypothetical protein
MEGGRSVLQRYTGPTDAIFPTLRPPLFVRPGEVVDRPELIEGFEPVEPPKPPAPAAAARPAAPAPVTAAPAAAPTAPPAPASPGAVTTAQEV